MEQQAINVRTYIDSWLEYFEEHPSRSWIVRYEALASGPEGTLEGLLAHIGEEFDPTDAYYFAGLGLADPKSSGRRQPVTVGRLLWDAEMTLKCLHYERDNLILGMAVVLLIWVRKELFYNFKRWKIKYSIITAITK